MGRRSSYVDLEPDRNPIEGPLDDWGSDEVPEAQTEALEALENALGDATELYKTVQFSFGGAAPMLPTAPGLTVEGMGTVPLPLNEDTAKKLAGCCERAPFGKGFDTVLDESVRKTWQLSMKPQDGKVSIRNPHFQDGLNKLMNEHITPRLGFKDGQLHCEPYKLLVYEPGGHFLKHQDTEKEDGMIATLVIQLPSEHQGGDLVVYQGNTMPKEFRHDFGKVDGTAPFAVHYAVHYADAAHSVERVTSGYRLALVYSICLPQGVSGLCCEIDPETGELVNPVATALRQVASEGSRFAWFLKHEYTEKSISEAGTFALKGLDRARFQALVDGNAQIRDPVSRMVFYLARLNLSIHYGLDSHSWMELEREKHLMWYALDGTALKKSSDDDYYYGSRYDPTASIINPDESSLSELWGEHGSNTYEGYMGNVGPTKNTIYERYIVVGWPEKQDLALMSSFIYPSKALKELASVPLTTDSFKTFFVSYFKKNSSLSVFIAEKLANFIVQNASSGAHLGQLFFVYVIDRVDDKRKLINSIQSLIQAFSWRDIGGLVSKALVRLATNRSISLEFVFELLSAIDATTKPDAFAGILLVTVVIATGFAPYFLAQSGHIGNLWKLTVNCKTDLRPVTRWCEYVKSTDPSMLHHFIKGFESSVSTSGESIAEAIATPSEALKIAQSAFQQILKLRLDWLNIRRRAGGDTWAMPEALFPSNPRVEAFLRGPDMRMMLTGFRDKAEASNFSRAHRHEQRNATFNMRAYMGTVTIIKTSDFFARNHSNGMSYEEEAWALSAACGEEFVPSPLGAAAATTPLPGCGPSQHGSHPPAKRRRASSDDIIVVDSD